MDIPSSAEHFNLVPENKAKVETIEEFDLLLGELAKKPKDSLNIDEINKLNDALYDLLVSQKITSTDFDVRFKKINKLAQDSGLEIKEKYNTLDRKFNKRPDNILLREFRKAVLSLKNSKELDKELYITPEELIHLLTIINKWSKKFSVPSKNVDFLNQALRNVPLQDKLLNPDKKTSGQVADDISINVLFQEMLR